MPTNWSFNQFHETTIGLGGSGMLGIDKNDYSGKDPGVSAVNPPDNPEISKEYRAKHDAFVEMGKNIPGLQKFAPELLQRILILVPLIELLISQILHLLMWNSANS